MCNGSVYSERSEIPALKTTKDECRPSWLIRFGCLENERPDQVDGEFVVHERLGDHGSIGNTLGKSRTQIRCPAGIVNVREVRLRLDPCKCASHVLKGSALPGRQDAVRWTGLHHLDLLVGIEMLVQRLEFGIESHVDVQAGSFAGCFQCVLKTRMVDGDVGEVLDDSFRERLDLVPYFVRDSKESIEGVVHPGRYQSQQVVPGRIRILQVA